jgi:hypothetical protein
MVLFLVAAGLVFNRFGIVPAALVIALWFFADAAIHYLCPLQVVGR